MSVQFWTHKVRGVRWRSGLGSLPGRAHVLHDPRWYDLPGDGLHAIEGLDNSPEFIRLNFQPIFYTEDDRVFCSSLDVARRFEKEHKHVLRDIQRYQVADHLQDFTGSNFGLSSYKDASGKSNPMYLMTRDGMTFLVTGFNGKEADLWKICYIAAFSAMEKKLREFSASPALPNEFYPNDINIPRMGWDEYFFRMALSNGFLVPHSGRNSSKAL